MENVFGRNEQAQKITMIQPLTMEEIKFLRVDGSKTNLKLSKKEYLKAVCTHKDPATGKISLTSNQDGTSTCTICNETFTLLSPGKFDSGAIEDICANFNDLVQSVKTMYGTISVESARELYTIAGFIPKFIDLYKVSIEYFTRLGGSGMLIQENQNPYMMGNFMHNPMSMGGSFGCMPAYMSNQPIPDYVQNQPLPDSDKEQKKQKQEYDENDSIKIIFKNGNKKSFNANIARYNIKMGKFIEIKIKEDFKETVVVFQLEDIEEISID